MLHNVYVSWQLKLFISTGELLIGMRYLLCYTCVKILKSVLVSYGTNLSQEQGMTANVRRTSANPYIVVSFMPWRLEYLAGSELLEEWISNFMGIVGYYYE